MVVFNSSNERIIVKELTEKYDATINKFFDRSKYKGGFSYKVFINQTKVVFSFKSFLLYFLFYKSVHLQF